VSLGSEEGARESKNLAVTFALLRAAVNLGFYFRLADNPGAAPRMDTSAFTGT
jgi:hypothetical protein